MRLNIMLRSLRVTLLSAVFVQVALAEQGEGTLRDPVTGEYFNVHRDWREGVVLNPATGDYTVTYKDSQGFFSEVIFVPATKIDPTLTSYFKQGPGDNVIRYSYRLGSGAKSKQHIDQFRTLASSINAGSLAPPLEWNPVAIPESSAGNSDLLLSWTYVGRQYPGGLAPGMSLSGFALESTDLPGIAIVKIIGVAPTTEWLGEYPFGGPIREQADEIVRRKNHVPRFAAVPRIPAATPFDVAVTLSAMQQHIKKDLIEMKLVDPVFAAKLDALLQAAIDAARGGATGALTNNLKYFRQAIQQASPGVGEDDDDGDADNGDDDSADGKAGNPNRLIDKLAARVLFFDVKYIEKRLSGNKKDQDD